jgi:hypothetical protein
MKTEAYESHRITSIIMTPKPNRRRSISARAYLALTSGGEVHPAPWILLGMLIGLILCFFFPNLIP